MSPPANKPPLIALTSGEPAGIGPDLCLQVARDVVPARLACLGDPTLFAARAAALGIAIEIDMLGSIADADLHRPGRLQLVPVPLAATVTAGQLDAANAPAVLEMLAQAADACLRGEAAALVTAPVHKGVINRAGIPFSGHTEFLAERTGTDNVVMLLASRTLRVALATIHLPLAAVPAAITRAGLTTTLTILDHDLRQRFGIARPRIRVLGLNPHAGEDGVLGSEEQSVIGPVVTALRARGLDISGPVAADSAFTPEALADIDAVLAMYHDQGLAPLKAKHFGEIVNVTLGLPILRTSVDHGTALTLAGTGRADHSSLAAALALALELAGRASR